MAILLRHSPFPISVSLESVSLSVFPDTLYHVIRRHGSSSNLTSPYNPTVHFGVRAHRSAVARFHQVSARRAPSFSELSVGAQRLGVKYNGTRPRQLRFCFLRYSRIYIHLLCLLSHTMSSRHKRARTIISLLSSGFFHFFRCFDSVINCIIYGRLMNSNCDYSISRGQKYILI